jgi:erythromycin esterase
MLASAGEALAAAYPLNAGCEEVIAKWVKAHAAPCNDKHYFNHLGEALAGKQIVAIGDPAPGTHEAYLLRRQVCEYLFDQQAFNILVIEASAPVCAVLNDYVLGGKSDPAAALALQPMAAWRTHEMLDVLEWLRERNASRQALHRIWLAGCDCTGARPVIPALKRFLSESSPDLMPALDHLEISFSLFEDYTNAHPDAQDELRLRAGNVHQRLAELAAQLDQLLARTSEADARSAIVRLLADMRTLDQAIEVEVEQAGENPPNFGVRHKFMSDNIDALLTARGAGRVVVWCSNIAAARATHDSCQMAITDRTLGSYLAERYRDRFYSIGMFAGTAETLPDPGGGYLEGALAGVRQQPYFVDLKRMQLGSAPATCLAHDTLWRTGYGGNRYCSEGAAPVRKDDFDGWLYTGSAIRASFIRKAGQ